MGERGGEGRGKEEELGDWETGYLDYTRPIKSKSQKWKMVKSPLHGGIIVTIIGKS